MSLETGHQRTASIFISTGEVSGDLQGALLIEALQRQASQRHWQLKVFALGGPRMERMGAELIRNTTTIGAVGILETLPYVMPTFFIQRSAQRYLRQNPPDVGVLIDYMGPNQRMGNFLRRHFPDLPTVYYIAPQQWVWAYSEKDTENIIRNSDQMLAIFQQEADYYQSFGANVSWVGHPLVDKFSPPPDRNQARQALGIDPEATVLTLLPASRHQEVRYLLPTLLKATQHLQQHRPDLKVLLPISSQNLKPALEKAVARSGVAIQFTEGMRQDAIAAADLALTKSGTVNLEIALMNVPQVVAYRLNPITARVAHYLLRFSAPYLCPVNLVEMKPVVPEFVQWQATPEAIAETALDLLENPISRQTMQAGYASMRTALGAPGACDRVANAILDLAEQRWSSSPTHPGTT